VDVFEQSTGRLYGPDSEVLGVGYAGREAGKNNPSMEMVKGTGPLPAGNYVGIKLFEVHPTVGKYAIQLQPDAETRQTILSYGRDPDSFFMHGDSSEHPGLASHGCIVQPRAVREGFWAGDKKVRVVAQWPAQ
jgi:hypothetical protein